MNLLDVKIATTVLLFIASLMLLFWVYRPGSAKHYENCRTIPIKDGEGEGRRAERN